MGYLQKKERSSLSFVLFDYLGYKGLPLSDFFGKYPQRRTCSGFAELNQNHVARQLGYSKGGFVAGATARPGSLRGLPPAVAGFAG